MGQRVRRPVERSVDALRTMIEFVMTNALNSGPLLDMLRKHVALLETNCCAFVEAVANLRVACGDVDARAHPYM